MSKNNSMQLQLPILVDVVSGSAGLVSTERRSERREQNTGAKQRSGVSPAEESVYTTMASRYFAQVAKIK